MTKQKIEERIAKICRENQTEKPFLRVSTKDAGSFYGRFSEINEINGLGIRLIGGTQFIDFSSIKSINYAPTEIRRHFKMTF